MPGHTCAPEAPSTPHTLVLLPGLMCDAQVWAGPVARLTAADAGLAVQVWPPGASRSLAEMAKAVLAQAPARFALAGHSMGGRVALEVLRQAPERITHLALLDTGYQALAPGEAGAKEREGRAGLQRLARAQGVAAMARQWVRGMVHPARLSEAPLIDAIVAMMARHDADTFDAQVQALLDRPDAEEVLRAWRGPTLVLCGAEDAWSPPERHQAMAAMVPGSRCVKVPHCGHMSPMEQPEAVAQALRLWLHTPRGGAGAAAATPAQPT